MKAITRRSILILSVVAMVALPLAASAVGGLGGPLFGLATAPNGEILVADAGAGISIIGDGVVRSTIALPGASAVDPSGRGSMWATTSGFDPEADSGQALWRISNGNPQLVANLFAVEARDPDGAGVDSNPYDVQSLNGRAALVVDAGGNDLIRANIRGRTNVLAVFPDEVVSTANLQDLIGCAGDPIPDFAFLCGIPAMPAQSVPTSVAIGPDGYYYVGELKGFPAPTGMSSIWRVSPHASRAECGQTPDCVKVFDGGFTSIIDLAFGPDGNLYVAEMDERSWAAVEFGIGGEGGTINSCDLATLTCDVVADGIPMLTAITFGNDGTLWATRNALIPGAGEVIQVP